MSNEERIAVLESKQDGIKEQLEDIETEITDCSANISQINTKLAKQQSFLAGIAFLATAIGFFLKAAWGYLQNKLL